MDTNMLFLSGNFMLLQGRFDDARNNFLQYVKELKNTSPDRNMAIVLKNIGICYKKQGKLEDGLVYYKKALELARNLDLQDEIADNISNIGVIYKNQALELREKGNESGFQSRLREAEKCYQEAKEIDRKTNNTNGLANDLNNLGIVYRHLGERSKAIGAYQESIKIAERMGEKALVGKAEMNIGAIYIDSELWDDSIIYLEKALASMAHGGNDQAYSITVAKYNLGLAYFNKGNPRKARANLKDAESLLKKMQIKDDALSASVQFYLKKCK